MISDRISDDTPPQTKILNTVIPILMHFCSFVQNLRAASRMSSNDMCIRNSIEVDKSSDQNLDLCPHWIDVPACFNSNFTHML